MLKDLAGNSTDGIRPVIVESTKKDKLAEKRFMRALNSALTVASTFVSI